MTFDERREPGDGTFAASFECPTCRRRVALLANPMESQLVGALGVKIGGRTLDQQQPFEAVRSSMVGRDDALQDVEPSGPRPRWTAASRERLDRVPAFVRGMVMRIYADWARDRGIVEITPEVMDKARVELGLENM
jgi:hypothetical protein